MSMNVVASHGSTGFSSSRNRRRLLGGAFFAALFAGACAQGPTNPDPILAPKPQAPVTNPQPPPPPPPPYAPPAPTSATLQIIVDAACTGKESSVQISVDGHLVGVAQPGDRGVSTNVSIGKHTVTARSQQGKPWGPDTVSVPTKGLQLRLTCEGGGKHPKK